ncbi:uncharacterized protein [Coffea arabica]|uniref:BSD domain-containing protein n=1 Tax=Coffea arabica TaxID=13443 RepID=A0A6P6X1L3_COFAR|nr:BSD domain-containing protein 1-like [Coffea arabica]
MDIFRSVFAEDPSPPSSPKTSSDPSYNSETTPSSPSNSQSQNPNPNPQISSVTTTSSWATFGSSFFKSVASKSESVIRNYRNDLEEFSSGLRKETTVIREAARRAVENLPGRLESGAAVAQTSLESVGQVIDDLGGAVSGIIIHGKDSIFHPNDGDFDASDVELVESGDGNGVNKQNLKPYSRIDALIRAMQCDIKTYCDEPEEVGEYEEWKKGFLIDEKIGEIEDLVNENGVIGEIYDEVVPGKVDRETFWSRYFYRVYRVKKAEEARVKLVRRAIEGEDEEDLSWDVDDDEEDGDSGFKSREELKKEIEETEKELANGDKKRSSVSEDSVEGRLEDGKSDRGSSTGKNDISDFSLVSSQRSSHEEEEIGWDEIEDIGSDDDTKVAARGGSNNADLQKLSTAAEKEEQLPWDTEDDDEPARS